MIDYRARIEGVMKLRCPAKKDKHGNPSPWTYIDSRETEHAHDFAYLVPNGYSAQDIQQETDALYAACGAVITITDRGGAVVISISKKDFPDTIPYSPELLHHIGGRKVLCGFDLQGRPITHDFRVPHMMIAGMSGYGKTDMIRFIIYQLVSRFTPEQLEIQIIDMKGFSFLPFRDIPHITRIGRDLNTACEILKDGFNEMNRRASIVWDARNRNMTQGFKWRMIVIDEASQISPILKESKEEKQIAALCWQYACAISSIGREAQVGLLYCTQYPTAEVIRGQIKANMDAVICFKTENDIHSNVTLNSPAAANLPHRKPGRAIFKNNGLTAFQVPYIGNDEKWNELLEPLRREQDEQEPTNEIENLDDFI